MLTADAGSFGDPAEHPRRCPRPRAPPDPARGQRALSRGLRRLPPRRRQRHAQRPARRGARLPASAALGTATASTPRAGMSRDRHRGGLHPRQHAARRRRRRRRADRAGRLGHRRLRLNPHPRRSRPNGLRTVPEAGAEAPPTPRTSPYADGHRRARTAPATARSGPIRASLGRARRSRGPDRPHPEPRLRRGRPSGCACGP